MKKIQLGQSVAILANLGVVVGIVFLVVEIGQNTEALTAQARYNHVQGRLAVRSTLMENADFSALLSKVAANEPLTPPEELQVAAYFQSIFISWQWEFVEESEGRLTEQDLPIEGWRLAMMEEGGSPTVGILDEWNRYKVQLREDFVAYMEANVIP